MTKQKNPTKKELTQIVANMDAGFRGLSNILKMYIEYKGDLIMFNQHIAEKQKEQEEKIRTQEQDDAEALAEAEEDTKE